MSFLEEGISLDADGQPASQSDFSLGLAALTPGAGLSLRLLWRLGGIQIPGSTVHGLLLSSSVNAGACANCCGTLTPVVGGNSMAGCCLQQSLQFKGN